MGVGVRVEEEMSVKLVMALSRAPCRLIECEQEVVGEIGSRS